MIVKIAGIERQGLTQNEHGFYGFKWAWIRVRFALILLEFHRRAAFAGGSQQAVEGLQFSH
jgi:hypothetical protein